MSKEVISLEPLHRNHSYDISEGIAIESSIENPIALSTIVGKIEFLPLQKSGRYVLDRIDKLLVTKERVFILNSDPYILAFTKEGKYVGVFDPVYEAGWLDDFDILPEEKGVVVLMDNNRIIFLDNDLKIKRRVTLPFKAASGPMIVDETTFIFAPGIRFAGQKQSSSGQTYRLLAYNPESESTTGLLPANYSRRDILDGRSLYRSEKMLFIDPVVDSVYVISSAGIDQAWHVQIPEKEETDPQKILEGYDSHHRLVGVMINRGVMVAGKYFPSGSAKPFADNSAVNLTDINLTCFSHINLETTEQSLIIINDMNNLFPAVITFDYYFPGGFISAISYKDVAGERRSSVPRDIRGVKRGDNPVLAFYYFKSDY